MALIEILGEAGLRPELVAGHSLGEYLALYAAGALDAETAISLVTGRGCRIAEASFQDGAMASVSLPAEALEERLESAAEANSFRDGSARIRSACSRWARS